MVTAAAADRGVSVEELASEALQAYLDRSCSKTVDSLRRPRRRRRLARCGGAAGNETLIGFLSSAVENRDRFNLDQAAGMGQRLHPHECVGWLVIPE